MKFFVDTASLSQIKEAADLGIVGGVTTNSTLMAQEGIKGERAINKHCQTICRLMDGDISAEIISVDFENMIEEGMNLAIIHPNIVVTVPMIKDGIKAIKWFSDNDIRTNCSLVYSAGQAILAAKAGASYVSPFVGRMNGSIPEGIKLIEQIANIFSLQAYKTQILATSIRSTNHMIRAAKAGANVCSVPLESILSMLKSPDLFPLLIPQNYNGMIALRKRSLH